MQSLPSAASYSFLARFATVIAGSIFWVSALPTSGQNPEAEIQGQYFAKKTYAPQPLPQFDSSRAQLPSPIFDENPVWVELYWKAWQLAFRNFHEPKPNSGFVSQFIDAAFNQNIFLWDTCFLTMFCNVAHPLVPGIGSLDNFYAKQHADGEICREIDRTTGVDYAEWINREKLPLFSRWGWAGARNDRVIYRDRVEPVPAPKLTLDALNHPILAWAEMESLRITGDTNRLSLVYEPLVRYYRALQKYLRQGNGLFMTDWASMDNSPRNSFLKGGGTAVDTSAQMVLFARQLGIIAEQLGNKIAADTFRREARDLSQLINELMWDSQRRFYFDLQQDGRKAQVKTIAAYWTLLAEVAAPFQAEALIAELNNPATFGRRNRVPTLAGDERGFDLRGGYWCGAVWAPTETMVIRGLEKYGHSALATQLAREHLQLVATVFQATGTIWENYAPDTANPGRPAMRDFVGWSGIAPILFLLDYGIGLKPDASKNSIEWQINSTQRLGCDRYRFNARVISLVAEPQARPPRLQVSSDGPFTLKIEVAGKTRSWNVAPGRNTFELP